MTKKTKTQTYIEGAIKTAFDKFAKAPTSNSIVGNTFESARIEIDETVIPLIADAVKENARACLGNAIALRNIAYVLKQSNIEICCLKITEGKIEEKDED